MLGKDGIEVLGRKSELDECIAQHEFLLVCFSMKGCGGCIMASRLIPRLKGGSCDVVKFVFSEHVGPEKYEEVGIEGTPQWNLYQNGEFIDSCIPIGDRDELYEFLIEKAGFELTRNEMDEALDEGEILANRVEELINEMVFTSDHNESGIISAARLKIMKSCTASLSEELDSCLDKAIQECVSRLEERLAEPDGDTESRREAIRRIPLLKEDLRNAILNGEE